MLETASGFLNVSLAGINVLSLSQGFIHPQQVCSLACFQIPNIKQNRRNANNRTTTRAEDKIEPLERESTEFLASLLALHRCVFFVAGPFAGIRSHFSWTDCKLQTCPSVCVVWWWWCIGRESSPKMMHMVRQLFVRSKNENAPESTQAISCFSFDDPLFEI